MATEEQKNISEEEINNAEKAEETAVDTEPLESNEEPSSALEEYLSVDDREGENKQKPVRPKKKFSLKKLPVQIPIIIAACILIGSVLGYLIFYGFFYKDPDGLWMLEDPELEGVVYYYSFDSSEKLSTLTIGSVDSVGGYDKVRTDEGNQIYINQVYGRLAGYLPYTISGTKLFGNQVLHITDGEYTYDLKHIGKVPDPVEPVEGFTPNKELTGTWQHYFEEYNVTYTFTFNEDGTMLMNQYDTNYIRGTYSYDDQYITFTYYQSQGAKDEKLEYSLNDGTLVILEEDFTRIESE